MWVWEREVLLSTDIGNMALCSLFGNQYGSSSCSENQKYQTALHPGHQYAETLHICNYCSIITITGMWSCDEWAQKTRCVGLRRKEWREGRRMYVTRLKGRRGCVGSGREAAFQSLKSILTRLVVMLWSEKMNHICD